MMSWSSSCYILLVIMCVVVLGEKHQSSERKLHDGRLEATGYVARDREKRSVSSFVKIGIEALEVLLTGTKPLPSWSKYYKRYQKPGNINTALFDFKGVADKRRGIEYMKAGEMRIWSGFRGDRHLLLKDPGAVGDPVLQVKIMKTPETKLRKDMITKIIYKE